MPQLQTLGAEANRYDIVLLTRLVDQRRGYSDCVLNTHPIPDDHVPDQLLGILIKRGEVQGLTVDGSFCHCA